MEPIFDLDIFVRKVRRVFVVFFGVELRQTFITRRRFLDKTPSVRSARVYFASSKVDVVEVSSSSVMLLLSTSTLLRSNFFPAVRVN